jgi:CRISPR-associated endonuclease/helicase Cas3
VDRDYLLARVLPRIEMGRQPAAAPFVVVATQTVEVGANLDFDALVTESAPFASLVQRLGRLNRSGEPGVVAPALVVQDSTVQTDDPVYGAARSATWQWLAEQSDPVRYTPKLDPATLTGGLPASPLALRHLAELAPDGLAPEDPYIPILDESTLDAWARTSPAPVPDPPVASFLHGLVEQRPVVSLVWRANLGEDPDRWAELVDAVPPAAEEMLEVALPAARRWLESAQPDARLSDQESEPDGEQPVEPAATVFRVRDGSGRPLVLAYRGRDDADVVPPGRIRPGDVVVVPVKYGGCDEYGWHPEWARDVVDVADLAWRRGRPVLRLGPYLRTVVAGYHKELVDSPQLADLLKAVSEDGAEALVRPDAYPDLLRSLGESSQDRELPLPRNFLRLAAASEGQGSLRTTLTSDGNGGPGPWPVLLSRAGIQLADDHSEAGSATNGGRERTKLDPHQLAVACRARQFAKNLGLQGLVEAVGIAARHHDEGKRDPRMQAMLWGGSRLHADAAAEPIAKSGMDPADRQAYRRAREQAGYPTGMRHEALSARIVAAYLAGMSEVDQDLVVHLVTSHHGRSRPLLPPIVDEAPETVTVTGIGEFSTAETVDWDAPRRFARLNQRYGRWGLALLETVVRLADIWCSARDESVKEERR